MYSARYLQNKTAGKFDKEVLMQCYADLTKLPIDEISLYVRQSRKWRKYDNYCRFLPRGLCYKHSNLLYCMAKDYAIHLYNLK